MRQIQGELRKLTHPLVLGSIVAAAVATSALQAGHVEDPYPGPSLVDVAGCLRIGFLQHATTIGFVLAGVIAAVGTADEAGRGALSDTFIREPRRRRVAGIKLATTVLGLLISVLVTTVSLLVTRFVLAAQGTTAPAMSRSHVTDTFIDVGASLPILALAAAIALVVASLTRSVIATIVVTATVFYLPLTILQDAIVWITPTRWIVEWLHLDPFGAGVDYLANDSVYDHRGAAAAAGGALIGLALIALTIALPHLLSRAALRANERNA